MPNRRAFCRTQPVLLQRGDHPLALRTARGRPPGGVRWAAGRASRRARVAAFARPENRLLHRCGPSSDNTAARPDSFPARAILPGQWWAASRLMAASVMRSLRPCAWPILPSRCWAMSGCPRCASRNGGGRNKGIVQPVKQILAEFASVHRRFQVTVGGGDHPHVHADGAAAAHPLELALQHLQQP